MADQGNQIKQREGWSSRLGIILAVSGSAVGLGNFLRFPAKVVDNGGGAFMIPYFISLLLLGIPLMWVEWTLGRYGGKYGHGTAPAIFQSLWRKNPLIKYLGVLGILGPLLIFSYYTYIESWSLAYSFFSLTGTISEISDQNVLKSFLSGYQGLEHNKFFNGLTTAYFFFLVTFIVNTTTIYFGIKGGIEKFCRFAMPVLFVLAFALAVRVITINTVQSPQFHWSISDGFGFFWNPDFSALKSAKVWLEAAGQIFFTLSVGIGCILTYASYINRKDDVALSGLTAVSTNEMAEVILGGSIIIPAAFVFFGPHEIKSIVEGGIFNLGFVTMPMVLNQFPLSHLLGFVWFFLLFLAGVTSSVSLAQPFIAFLEDEFNLTRQKAVMAFAGLTFLMCQPAIFFLGNGVVDEIDFWGGSFCLVVFATVEIILFGWVFGIDKAWAELHEGALIKIPKIYKYIIKYVTPLFLLTILSVWAWQQWIPIIMLKGVAQANQPHILWTRIGIIALFLVMALMVKIVWKKKVIEGD